MKKTKSITFLVSLLFLTGSYPLLASEPGQTQKKITDPTLFAQVNGVELSKDMFDFVLQSREKEYGDTGEMADIDHPSQSDLQDKAAKDLIMTLLLAEQATTSKLHESPRFKMELELFQQTLLAQLYVQQIMENIEVDEAHIRKRYEQQPAQTLYRFMIWQTPDPSLAAATLQSLQSANPKGVIDERVTEIETPWLLGSDIDPQVEQKVLNLGVNEFVAAPIAQDGVWKVVQLLDKKAFAKQSYELERDIIRSEIVSEELQATLDALLAGARVIVNEEYSVDRGGR